MSELRWALLLVGLLFVAGLVAWELRKRRAREAERSAGGMAMGRGTREAVPGGRDAVPTARGHDAGLPSGGAGTREEPAFSMPDLPRRDPVRELPVVEFDPRASEGPRVGDLPLIRMDGTVAEGASEQPAAGESADDGGIESVSPAREASSADAVEKASAWLADSVPDEAPQAVVLDWPPEEQRRIVGLRVVPRSGERFNGSALRQALVGEGFIHGELDIYHKPTGDGRALLSAASLTRPGTFDPRTIDGLLFAGLNLFAVLPGPLPPRETVERLVLVGRTLAQRLRGEALDGRGQPLTDARVAELRREASEGQP